MFIEVCFASGQDTSDGNRWGGSQHTYNHQYGSVGQAPGSWGDSPQTQSHFRSPTSTPPGSGMRRGLGGIMIPATSPHALPNHGTPTHGGYPSPYVHRGGMHMMPLHPPGQHIPHPLCPVMQQQFDMLKGMLDTIMQELRESKGEVAQLKNEVEALKAQLPQG